MKLVRLAWIVLLCAACGPSESDSVAEAEVLLAALAALQTQEILQVHPHYLRVGSDSASMPGDRSEHYDLTGEGPGVLLQDRAVSLCPLEDGICSPGTEVWVAFSRPAAGDGEGYVLRATLIEVGDTWAEATYYRIEVADDLSVDAQGLFAETARG